MIKLMNVSKYYHGEGTVTLALDKINLAMSIGEFIAITGESGSGKSTLLNVISGIDSYEDGELYINGEETSHYDQKDWEDYRKEKIAFIFQNYNLIDSYSVLKNVEAALIIQGISKKERIAKAKDIIEKVGLTSHLHHKASKLSGGQKQRVAIARALAKDTEIIVADEPTGNLDRVSSAQILELLNQISKDKLVLVVTHNYEFAESYVSRKIRLFDGKIVEDKEIKPVVEKSVEMIEKKNEINLFQKASSLAKLNLLFQPKKMIFMFLVSLVVVFFIFFMYAQNKSTPTGRVDYRRDNSYPERIIATRKDEKLFEEEDYDFLQKSKYFYEIIQDDYGVEISLHDIDRVLKQSFDNYNYIPKREYRKTEMIGNYPADKDDIFFEIYMHAYPEGALEALVGTKINMRLNSAPDMAVGGAVDHTFTIVGFANKNVGTGYHVTKEMLNYFSMIRRGSIHSLQTMYQNYDDPGNYNLYDVTFLLDPELEGKEVKLKLDSYVPISKPGKKAFFIKEEEMIIKDMVKNFTYKGNIIYISPEYYEIWFPYQVSQITLHLSNAEVYKESMEYLYQNGYYGYSPLYDAKTQMDEVYHIIDTVELIFKYIGVILIFVIIYLFAYVIFKAVLKSKMKDYTVFRIFGANHRLITSVIYLELMILFTISYILFLGFYLFYGRSALWWSGELVFVDFILIFLINLFMSIFIGRRFIKQQNKKSLFANLKIE